MRFFWDTFRLSLRARLCSWRTWAFALLLPAMVWAFMAWLPANERAAPVQVGVSLPAEGGAPFWERLQGRSGVAVAFVAADADTVRAKVATGQWDCGLLLPEDFAARVQQADTRALLTLCVGEGSTAYPLVRETAAACLAELAAPGIAREYLLESGIATEQSVTAMAPRLQEALPDTQRVGVTLRTLDGGELEPIRLADAAWGGLLHGLLAVVLLIWAMFSAVDMGRWLCEPATKRLKALRGCAPLLLPRQLAAAVPVFLAAALALWPLSEGAPALWALLGYLAALCALAALAARFGPVWRALPVLTPAMPVVCLLAAPILFDPAAVFPALDAVCRWLPVGLYLRAAQGVPGCLPALWAWAAAPAAALALPERRR